MAKIIPFTVGIILSTTIFNVPAHENTSTRTISRDIMTTYDENIKEENSFFGFMSRLRYINRWATLQCRERENLEHHSYETAIIAHALVTIKNIKFGAHLDANRAAVIALYHDVTEVVTGDMPTPIKYYDKNLKTIYSDIEEKVIDEIVEFLPEEFRETYKNILLQQEEEENDKELFHLVKAADTISAIIKCYREKKLGNNDFDRALKNLMQSINKYDDPAVKYFINTFLPAFGYSV